MALRLKTQAEPFTDYSKGKEPILATSDEYRRLRRDLERYTDGLIQGRSYLIAGHRGSGKTMLVHKAIEDVVRNSVKRESRPLLVRLHGPDLLPVLTENNGTKAVEVKPDPAAPAPGHNKEAPAKPDSTVAADGAAAATVEEAASNGTDAAAAETKKQIQTLNELDIVLTQMMKSLFRDVANEYRRCYREKILRLDKGIKRSELLELAAQFDLELTEYLTPSRLRAYWRRIEAFEKGILLAGNRANYKTYDLIGKDPEILPATDIGLQEILVLSLLSQAFQVISGTVEEKKKETDAAKNERSSSLTTAYALNNLFAPIAGLLTGGFVGISLGKDNPIAAVLLGLLSGAVVTLGFNYTSKKSRTKEMSLESVFIKDRTVATLSSVLPQLVVRLREIGLAPVFVIDELDKVQKLQTRMEKLVRHLKFLVTENSFSCFLTDRRYLNDLHLQTSQHAYAREYTYFSDQLVILYRPDELREFVQKVLESAPPDPTPENQTPIAPATQEEQDRVEIAQISYVLLHQARMHPIDLRRHLDGLTAKLKFTMSDYFPLTRSRFEMLIQVAIEWLLGGDDIQGSLNGNAYYGLVVYDALYYVSRLWEDAGADKPSVPGHRDFGNAIDKKPGLELNQTEFCKYLESRSSPEDAVQPPQNGAPSEPKPNGKPPAPLPAPITDLGFQGKDFEFLFRKVGELLNFLCKPENLVNEIRGSARQSKPDSIILSELPVDAPVRLLIQDPKIKTHYRWIYDATGRPLQTSKVGEIFDEDFEDAMTYLTDSMKALGQLGPAGDLETLALAKVLPRPNVWKTTLPTAMDRLDQLKVDANEYANMDVDRATVLECYSTLNTFALNIRAALLMAAFFTPEVSPAEDDLNFKLNFALTRISEILQLAATQDEDLRRLIVLMNSLPNDLVRQFNDLEPIRPAVEEWSKKSAASEESAKEIIKSGWEIAKGRFTKRLKEGTARFDPVFEDVFTAFRKIGPGHELGADFSTITSYNWTRLMLRSLSTDELPTWMRVAAAIELGMLDLAGKLATTTDDSTALSQWVEDARRRASAQTERHNIGVLAAEQDSLAESWKPSSRHGAIVATALDFGRLIDKLSPHAPALNDYPISLVAIELTTGKQLEQLITLPPLSVISQMSSNASNLNLTILGSRLESVEVCYFVKDLSVSPTSAPGTRKIIGSPKGLDDLIDRVFSAT